ncbi:MAG: HAMP domain-containing sensor histidine kinase [Clostridiales bacterium]|jgi:signal transduction histidine kinase|nr:HAMP domain-containing histidine kinase [Eubacteriales bacterium]MDH7566052.1 HAMP domain-containing sensor histidine kinase [Clostridiales bacterium]
MKGIGFKLWAGMMVLVIIVLVLLWLFQIVFLENFYTGMRVSDIKNEGASIAKLLGEGSEAEFKNKADAFAFSNNLSVELVDPGGNIVYTTGPTGYGGQMPMMRNRKRLEAFQEVLAGKEVTIPLSHPRFGNKFMLMGLPVKKAGELTGVLFINMPLAPVEDTASILKKQLIFITLILLVAAVMISYMISRTFTKPILEIKKTAEKMASGDFSDRIKARSKDEIGKLAETINYMGQELSKIDQLRKDLIANVSHELRTPLSLIRGYAETIRDVSGNVPEKREKQLGIIIEESERLTKIVDDILNLSQMQAGYLKLNPARFMLNKTVEDVVKRYDILSEKTGIKVIFENAGDILVTADEPRIEQVLYNLINNAFNHTPEGGSIAVKVMDGQDTVKVEVWDTGTGISDEDIRHVWDRYYKADKTSGRKIVGTGLGLAIVKSILEAHKALYGVESKKGAGTRFWFELQK